MMKAITVCVQYDDLLAATLPGNAKHFDEVLIVTAPNDLATAELVNRAMGIRTKIGGLPQLFQTEAFYHNGADFNKGASLEEAFDVLGRSGWFCLLDADTVLPPTIDVDGFEVGHFYNPRRRWCDNPRDWDGGYNWSQHRQVREVDMGGYCVFFHADDPVLQTKPWYPTDWRHAGGGDTIFNYKWDKEHKHRIETWEVLHLGPAYTNWFGRTSDRLDGTKPEGHESRAGKIQQMKNYRRSGFGFSKEKL